MRPGMPDGAGMAPRHGPALKAVGSVDPTYELLPRARPFDTMQPRCVPACLTEQAWHPGPSTMLGTGGLGMAASGHGTDPVRDSWSGQGARPNGPGPGNGPAAEDST